MPSKRLKIFCDLNAPDHVLASLKRDLAPHELVFPANPARSVLSNSDPNPALAAADIAFGQPDAAGVLEAPNLRWLQISSAGFTRYDTAEFRKAAAQRKLAVTNSSSVYAEPCAEHVLAFMLAQVRKLPAALRAASLSDSDPWHRLRDDSILLKNQSVVVLGFGTIGRHLANLLRPFGTRITALRRTPSKSSRMSFITPRALSRALAQADHVVNLLPANPDSVHFMSAARFAAMKKGSVFYNIGRGTTVDQEALLAALRSGHLAAAWLDVTDPEPLPPDHPLLGEPNCFLTPHLAGGHHDESQTLVRHFLDNFRRYLKRTPLRDRIM